MVTLLKFLPACIKDVFLTYVLKMSIVSCFMMISCSSVGGFTDLPIKIQHLSELDQHVIDKYNDYFGVKIFELVESESDCALIYDTDTLLHDDNLFGHASLEWGADGKVTNCVIRIRDDLDDWEYTNILAHELGHVLGAPHMDSGIMDPSVSGIRNLDTLFDGEFNDWVRGSYADMFID